jgi:hypothetical protein
LEDFSSSPYFSFFLFSLSLFLSFYFSASLPYLLSVFLCPFSSSFFSSPVSFTLLHFSLFLCFSLIIYLPFCLFTHFLYLFVSPSVEGPMSFSFSTFSSLFLFLYISISLILCLSLSLFLSIFLAVSLSFCLSVFCSSSSLLTFPNNFIL